MTDNGGYDAAVEVAHIYPLDELLKDGRIVSDNAYKGAGCR